MIGWPDAVTDVDGTTIYKKIHHVDGFHRHIVSDMLARRHPYLLTDDLKNAKGNICVEKVSHAYGAREIKKLAENLDIEYVNNHDGYSADTIVEENNY